MVVRSGAYMKQGGMNKRKAGEDFYFLQKIFLLGGFTEINTTCVRPSPRPSDRVPFGTGKQITKFLNSGTSDYIIYSPKAFRDIKKLFDNIRNLRNKDDASHLLQKLPKVVNRFLKLNDSEENLMEIRKNTSNEASFRKRFFQWFNGFMVLKYMHYCRDFEHPNIDLIDAVNELLNYRKLSEYESPNVIELLNFYRNMDREIAVKYNDL